MPEEWNQVSFDDHVHDSNTKGRKSPSHLIMDAWIKGIRRLIVIYVLRRRPEVSRLLLDGIVGKKFSKALSFYLDNCEEYLNEIEKVTIADFKF